MANWLNREIPPLWRWRARTAYLSRGWQALARRAYVLGERDLGDMYQALADYWALPFWRQYLGVYAAMAVERRLQAFWRVRKAG